VSSRTWQWINERWPPDTVIKNFLYKKANPMSTIRMPENVEKEKAIARG
jgi:hypothetical protein